MGYEIYNFGMNGIERNNDDPLAESRISSFEGIMWDFKLEDELTRVRSHISHLAMRTENPQLYLQTVIDISHAARKATWCIVGSINREEQVLEAALVIEEAVQAIHPEYSDRKETTLAIRSVMLERAASLREALRRHRVAVAERN